jgi:CheY-like chemotaxis protein
MPIWRIRTILADDFVPFRLLLSSMLQRRPELQVIAEASDGLQAVQKAQQLQPGLVLLDIGLPELNGIEAARRIRNVSPLSKIVFVTQLSSPEVVSEALSTGASGYVVKTDAGRELLSALDAVLWGGQFISSTITVHDFTGTTRPVEVQGWNATVFSNVATANVEHRHEAAFFSDEQDFIDGLTSFIVPALREGSAVIALTTHSHRDRLLPQLHAHGAKISAAIEQGRYMSLDVAEVLSAFMVDGFPDRAEFLRTAADLIRKANGLKLNRRGVAACGECAPVLWTHGNPDAAIELEKLWDEVAASNKLNILCGYSLASFRGETGSQVLTKICAEHSAAYPR